MPIESRRNRGVAGGVATLGPDGKLTAGQIPDGLGGGGPHTHPQSEVTGLEAALSAKADAAHSHPAPSWTDVTGKPTEFAPSAHSHAQSDVTGLDAALAGKAASSHTHAQADVTGLVSALAGKSDTSHTHAVYQLTSEKAAANGYASLGADGKVPSAQLPVAGGSAALTKTAAATTAAGADLTWLVLAANSSDITGTGLTTVMTITGVGAGRYYFKCVLIYQTTALTTGIDVAVNHTGTTTRWLCEHRFAGTGGAAATAAATEAGAAATGNLYEAQGNRTKNAIIGAGTVSVDAINADMMSVLEGYFVVTVSGDLQIKLAAEATGLVCRAIEGSFLELKKLS